MMVEEYEERRFEKNEFFLKQGRISDSIQLLEGLMRAYTFDGEGNEVTTNFFSKNMLFIMLCCLHQVHFSNLLLTNPILQLDISHLFCCHRL